MKNITSILLIIISITATSCHSQKKEAFKAKEVYTSQDLIITQIAENAFEHTSYMQTDDFGNVPCNGLIVKDNNEVIVFDTPTTDKSSELLIAWLKDTLHCKIKAIIPTHFHDDCLGGLGAFHKNNVPSYAYYKTITLAKEHHFTVPENSFNDSLHLKIGREKVIVKFFGEGHTKDNVVGYFPKENILFGGCLIKAIDASKGYLGDANVSEWSNTVEKLKVEYPNAKIIIPGHGDYGDQKLLDYTIGLFKVQ
ncbi:subclass B1 metallo-beta-lactamase [Flavobacterium humi]|uniref:beta-lactamase n=1 Tax=Flavobacterium humi TaxID=2562683 RepID=A0A4Z0LBY2_9FLAO|nr:subclass B1 metallo-beta-lactamase [Flavobacterium humi]TGD59378.1 subclass B1 metallo-beta-lactamase [Flavobacterium humi]